MEWFMHTRKLHNIKYDMSLTPSFFTGSTVELDVIHFVKWVDPGKLLYGTDYPYTRPSEHKTVIDTILKRANVSKQDTGNIYSNNYLNTYTSNTKSNTL